MNLRRNLPPMGALLGFEAAARHQSISLAAQELNLTHGAVSRSVQQLEEFFGFPLFQRRNRRVFLTVKGRLLSDRLTPLLGDLSAVVDEVRGHEQEAIVLSCEPTLAMRWLMPRLPGKDRGGPPVQLQTAGGPVDLARQAVDLAIRRSDFQWPSDYCATPLAAERVGPVCHPAYWDRIGGNLCQATFLTTQTRKEAWADWLSRSGMQFERGQESLFDHFYFSLQAAVAGLGVAIGPELMVMDDIAAGHLVAPFGFLPSGYDYVALSLIEPASDDRLQAILSWLESQFGSAAG